MSLQIHYKKKLYTFGKKIVGSHFTKYESVSQLIFEENYY